MDQTKLFKEVLQLMEVYKLFEEIERQIKDNRVWVIIFDTRHPIITKEEVRDLVLTHYPMGYFAGPDDYYDDGWSFYLNIKKHKDSLNPN